MKTDMKTIAALLAGAIWADGEYDEAEVVTVEEIAEAFEYDVVAMNAEMDAALAQTKDMDEAQLNAFVAEAAKKVDQSEVETVLEAVLQMVISDNVVSIEEAEIVESIARALGISAARTILMVADVVKSEPELEIEF